MANNAVRLQNGQQIIIDEWLHWPVYSTHEFAAGQKVDLLAFTYTEGTNVPSVGVTKRTSTLCDTNMNAKSRTNQDEELVIFSITPEIIGLSNASSDPEISPPVAPFAALAPLVSAHNMRVLQEELLIEFYVGAKVTKPQMRAPLGLLPSSVGTYLHGTANYGGDNALDVGHNGPVSACSQWKFELPVRVESDKIVKLRAFSPRALTRLNQSIRIRWYLDCLKKRPFG